MLYDIISLKTRLNEFNLSDIRFVLPNNKHIIIQRMGARLVVIGLGYECVVHSIDSLIGILKSYDVPYSIQGVA